MGKSECCGTCRWHKRESIDDGWVCCNPDSDYLGDWTEYSDFCFEGYEERE